VSIYGDIEIEKLFPDTNYTAKKTISITLKDNAGNQHSLC